MKRINIPKFQGVYSRDSANRRYLGKPDRCFDICFRDQSGKLIWEKVGWTSEGYSAQMAANIRAERMRAIRHGEELPSKKPSEATFGEVWNRYDEWLETSKSRPQDDRYYYRKHLEPRFAAKPLSKISPFELEKMKMELLKQELAPATVKHNLVLVRQIFNKAIAWGMWNGENPVRKVNLPKLNNRRERFLSVEQAQLLLEELGNVSDQLHDMAILSLQTGMRAGEVFNLKWVHLDYENDIILVADPKKGMSRKAFMTPEVKEMLRHRGNGAPEALVFPARGKKQIAAISKSFFKTVEQLGFNEGITDARQRVCFHTLRHTFASWLAIQGTPILAIKELMGHRSLAMTERYSHLIPDMKREAVAGIAKMMEKKEGVSPKGATVVREPRTASRKKIRREDQASV
jgi:integrase